MLSKTIRLVTTVCLSTLAFVCCDLANAADWVTAYEQDFSSEPVEWTFNTSNFYWDAANQRLAITPVTGFSGHAYVQVPPPESSFRVSWTFGVMSFPFVSGCNPALSDGPDWPTQGGEHPPGANYVSMGFNSSDRDGNNANMVATRDAIEYVQNRAIRLGPAGKVYDFVTEYDAENSLLRQSVSENGTIIGSWTSTITLRPDVLRYITICQNRTITGWLDDIRLEVPGRRPIADAGGPYVCSATGWEGASVQLDGGASYDPEGGELAYMWDVDLAHDSDGDGDATNDVDETGPTPLVTFPIGQTDISLTVTDDQGLVSDPDVTTVTMSTIDVEIDIKPGSDPNSINLGSHGVIPVAFLTTPDFDAGTIDPATVTLRGEDFGGFIKLRGKKDAGNPMAELEDVDLDGDLDLVVHLLTERLAEHEVDTIVEIAALTNDGYVVSGSDLIHVVPE